ncbi:hypothetical protein [Pandoraea pulmonicola]|uniref:Uncharacterized protein n=1 Tax=Pandoraea pulmonicola TaxID=93221 RepID=A0AAJ4ZC84_PANPU|nr:hypothetical protein [Pandoraea pulmonicola]AJC20753.1 hypothetical protein RO07_10225 [Pandoraea pulmonicola]SUA90722.1 Uncharacterised protein [Pandoraea pulmonicola]
MSGEIISGLVGGLFGTLVGKVLGRFRLWKVFVVTLVILYAGAFLMGIVLVGFKKALPIFSEMLAPTPLFVFIGLSVSATFVAHLGRNATKKMGDSEGN